MKTGSCFCGKLHYEYSGEAALNVSRRTGWLLSLFLARLICWHLEPRPSATAWPARSYQVVLIPPTSASQRTTTVSPVVHRKRMTGSMKVEWRWPSRSVETVVSISRKRAIMMPSKVWSSFKQARSTMRVASSRQRPLRNSMWGIVFRGFRSLWELGRYRNFLKFNRNCDLDLAHTRICSKHAWRTRARKNSTWTDVADITTSLTCLMLNRNP